ncbi:MAG: hypothetical protein ACPH29_05255, partial [Gammaproteobacteria bacterium]
LYERYKRYGPEALSLEDLAVLEAAGVWPEVDMELLHSPIVKPPEPTDLRVYKALRAMARAGTTLDYLNGFIDIYNRETQYGHIAQVEVQQVINPWPESYVYYG